MAAPVCTTANLNSGCFQDPTIDAHRRLVFKLWYLSNQLAYLGGTNWLANPQGLFSASNSVFEKMSMNQVDAAEVSVFYNNALAAGAPVVTDPNVTVLGFQHFNNLDTNDLQKIKVFLECSLGIHKTFPQ